MATATRLRSFMATELHSYTATATWLLSYMATELHSYMAIKAGSNNIGIKLLRHHTVSVSNFQNIDWQPDGSFITLFLDTGANSSIYFSIHRLNYFFPNIFSSFSLYKLDSQVNCQASSIEHDSDIKEIMVSTQLLIHDYISYHRAS